MLSATTTWMLVLYMFYGYMNEVSSITSFLFSSSLLLGEFDYDLVRATWHIFLPSS
jgi:hypothetical protein